jgi:hypothetical protein
MEQSFDRLKMVSLSNRTGNTSEKCKSQKSNIKNVELPRCGSDFLNFAFCDLIFELKRQYGQKGGKGD